jgi:hypothetical protein
MVLSTTPPAPPRASMIAFDERQSAALSAFHTLRMKVIAFHVYAGSDFARDAAIGWRDRRWAGLAAACWALSLALGRKRGAEELAKEARSLSAAFATEAHTSMPEARS